MPQQHVLQALRPVPRTPAPPPAPEGRSHLPGGPAAKAMRAGRSGRSLCQDVRCDLSGTLSAEVPRGTSACLRGQLRGPPGTGAGTGAAPVSTKSHGSDTDTSPGLHLAPSPADPAGVSGVSGTGGRTAARCVCGLCLTAPQAQSCGHSLTRDTWGTRPVSAQTQNVAVKASGGKAGEEEKREHSLSPGKRACRPSAEESEAALQAESAPCPAGLWAGDAGPGRTRGGDTTPATQVLGDPAFGPTGYVSLV